MFGIGLDIGNIATTEQLEQINNKMDMIINLLQGKPIDYKEPKPIENKEPKHKKVKEKKVKEKK